MDGFTGGAANTFGKISGGLSGISGGLPGVLGGSFLGGKVGSLAGNSQIGKRLGIGQKEMINTVGAAPGGYPTYIGMDPESTQVGANNSLNRAPLNQFENEAMRTGPSKGAQIAMEGQAQSALQSKEDLAKQAAGQAANGKADLAMHGGLTGGAAAMLDKQTANNAIDAGQGVERQAMTNKMNIGMQDEGQRVGMLSQAPGMEQNAAQYGYNSAAGDAQRMSDELAKRNAFGLGAYNTQMQTWGAGKQADATANSGKK